MSTRDKSWTTFDDPDGVDGTFCYNIAGDDIIGDASANVHGFLYNGNTTGPCPAIQSLMAFVR